MIEKDWRLTGQMKYLFQKTLVYRSWSSDDPAWDHDHRAFCGDKFSNASDTLRAGYGTDDPRSRNQRWICPACFQDFKEMFQWRVKNCLEE